MNREIELLKKESRDEGRQEAQEATVLRMLKEKMPRDLIARVTEFPIDKIGPLARANGLAQAGAVAFLLLLPCSL